MPHFIHRGIPRNFPNSYGLYIRDVEEELEIFLRAYILLYLDSSDFALEVSASCLWYSWGNPVVSF